MRAFPTILAAMAWTVVAVAQQPPAAEPRTYSSAADVAALIAKAKAERKDQPTISQRILQLAPYNANLEYRASVGPAAVHETEAELFYVIDGSAKMITGGKLVNEKRTDAANLTGTAIEGGTSRPIAKGDFVVVPEKTPHWFSAIDGTIVLNVASRPEAGSGNQVKALRQYVRDQTLTARNSPRKIQLCYCFDNRFSVGPSPAFKELN